MTTKMAFVPNKRLRLITTPIVLALMQQLVSLPTILSSEPLVANVALKRLFTRVGDHVSLQVLLRQKHLVAYLAFDGVCGVNATVPPEVLALGEALATNRTVVSSPFFRTSVGGSVIG